MGSAEGKRINGEERVWCGYGKGVSVKIPTL